MHISMKVYKNSLLIEQSLNLWSALSIVTPLQHYLGIVILFPALLHEIILLEP